MSTRPALPFAALVLGAPLVHATDWVVDDQAGPDVDFTSIQAAIDAAQTGDHVLVRSGTYAGFVLDGKGIVIAEAAGEHAAIVGTARVTNVPWNVGVQLIGLTIDAPSSGTAPAVEIASSVGAVLVARCVVRGRDSIAPTDALRATNADRVVVDACEIRGGDASSVNSPWNGGDGVDALSSSLEFHRCTVIGGRGGSDFDGSDDDDLFSGWIGGSGIVLSSSTAFVARCSVHGGAGGDASADFISERCPGDGGAAVRATSSTLSRYLSNLVGGFTGFQWGFPNCNSGPHLGLPVDPPTAVSDVARTAYCFGVYDRCPCGNESTGGRGCDNSFDGGGALLDVAGDASLGADTLTLTTSGIGASAPTLFFQGTTSITVDAGSAFGDGLRCAGGTVRRLGSRSASGGSVSIGFAAGDAPLSVTGAVPSAGSTRYYQAWYRNSAPFCTSSTFNLTNAYEILWGS